MKYSLLIVVFFLVGCIGFDYDYRISLKSCKELRYSELPIKVQKYLIGKDMDSYAGFEMMLVIDNNKDRYRDEAVETGPWIAYMKVVDTQKNIVYRIETSTPSPYIIYNEKLYIPNKYNLRSYNCREMMYYEYELK